MPSGRKRSYFSFPNIDGLKQYNRVGENTRLHRGTAVFLMILIGLIAWTQALLPGINDIECGQDYDQEYQRWYNGIIDPAEREKVDNAVMNSSLDERVSISESVTSIRFTIDGGTEAIPFPQCDRSLIIPSNPSERNVQHFIYATMLQFLPVLVLVPILFLIFKQVGTIAMFPAFLICIIAREIVPGDGLMDWIIMVVGITIACIPIPVGGLLAALMHMGALALWPSAILAYFASRNHVIAEPDIIIPGTILLILEIMVWIIPFGILVLLPVRWKMVDNEVVDV